MGTHGTDKPAHRAYHAPPRCSAQLPEKIPMPRIHHLQLAKAGARLAQLLTTLFP